MARATSCPRSGNGGSPGGLWICELIPLPGNKHPQCRCYSDLANEIAGPGSYGPRPWDQVQTEAPDSSTATTLPHPCHHPVPPSLPPLSCLLTYMSRWGRPCIVTMHGTAMAFLLVFWQHAALHITRSCFVVAECLSCQHYGPTGLGCYWLILPRLIHRETTTPHCLKCNVSVQSLGTDG